MLSATVKVGKNVQNIKGYATKGIIDDDDMGRIADYVIAEEIKRTQEGFDVEGNPFVGYSPRHAKARQRKGLQVEHVDLTFNNEMLNDLTSALVSKSISNQAAVIFFEQVETMQRALWHIRGVTERNLPQRQFHGISDETMDGIVQLVNQIIAQKMGN